MALAYTFADLATATTFRNALDVQLGYPKPGIDVGGGVHAPPAQSVTPHYAGVLKHPTLATCAILSDATITPVVTAAANALAVAVPVSTALDGTWTGGAMVA